MATALSTASVPTSGGVSGFSFALFVAHTPHPSLPPTFAPTHNATYASAPSYNNTLGLLVAGVCLGFGLVGAAALLYWAYNRHHARLAQVRIHDEATAAAAADAFKNHPHVQKQALRRSLLRAAVERIRGAVHPHELGLFPNSEGLAGTRPVTPEDDHFEHLKASQARVAELVKHREDISDLLGGGVGGSAKKQSAASILTSLLTPKNKVAPAASIQSGSASVGAVDHVALEVASIGDADRERARRKHEEHAREMEEVLEAARLLLLPQKDRDRDRERAASSKGRNKSKKRENS